MTKQLQRDVQSLLKNLKSLTQKTERMVAKVNMLEKAPGGRRTAAKPAKKVTAIDTVYGIIKRSRKGVNATTLKMKTGYGGRKIFDIVHKLKKQGKIKSPGKGIYVKV